VGDPQVVAITRRESAADGRHEKAVQEQTDCEDACPEPTSPRRRSSHATLPRPTGPNAIVADLDPRPTRCPVRQTGFEHVGGRRCVWAILSSGCSPIAREREEPNSTPFCFGCRGDHIGLFHQIVRGPGRATWTSSATVWRFFSGGWPGVRRGADSCPHSPRWTEERPSPRSPVRTLPFSNLSGP